jgi:hypothetical protein
VLLSNFIDIQQNVTLHGTESKTVVVVTVFDKCEWVDEMWTAENIIVGILVL